MSNVQLIHGECNRVIRESHWPRSERFQLAYLDPPFFTQRNFCTPSGDIAFSDRWKSLKSYVWEVTQACLSCFDRLSDDGSFVVHIDPRTSHYLKVSLDEALGRECFASEIVWRYRRWPSKTRNNFQRVHDVLLRYVKNPKTEPRFARLYEPLAASTRKQWGDRKQKAVTEGGRRVRSSKSAEASPGVPMGDVWDISIIAPSAHERTGYPTQKPEALLERLILSLTLPGDRVLDPMCGSGTTLAVAKRLGRHAVGIDSSAVAIQYARARLGHASQVRAQL